MGITGFLFPAEMNQPLEQKRAALVGQPEYIPRGSGSGYAKTIPSRAARVFPHMTIDWTNMIFSIMLMRWNVWQRTAVFKFIKISYAARIFD
jgi:hypothetical protein